MRLKPLSIVVVGIAGVVVALILLWNRNNEALPFPGSVETIARSRQPPLPPEPVAPPLPRIAESSAHAVTPAPASAVRTAETADPAPEMPMRVLFRRPIKSNQMIARIFNSASEPITLEVRILETSTHRTQALEIDVPANGWASIGGDDNVQLDSGDQVTLQSAPYRDLVTQIP